MKTNQWPKLTKLPKMLTALFAKKKQPLIASDKPMGDFDIQKKDIDHNAFQVCRTLTDHGFEAWIVGGAVRDLLLGHSPKDFDIATNARPAQVKKMFRKAFIIGNRFPIVHVIFGQDIVEVITFRGDSGETVGDKDRPPMRRRAPTKSFANVDRYGTQTEDAERRDFSVNALYLDPIEGVIRSFHQGIEHLQQGLLVVIGQPAVRYREDPVRILRAIRLAAKTGLTIESSAQQEIRKQAHLLKTINSGRLQDEWQKLLHSGAISKSLDLFASAQFPKHILPWVDWLQEVRQQPMVAECLALTDERVKRQLPISMSFVLAIALWPKLSALYQKQLLHTNAPYTAMSEVMQSVENDMVAEVGIARKLLSDAKGIWLSQLGFHKTRGGAPVRLMTKPTFKAALHLLELRAKHHEVDEPLVRWWQDLWQAQQEQNQERISFLLEDANQPPVADNAAPKSSKRKRPRYRQRRPSNEPKIIF